MLTQFLTSITFAIPVSIIFALSAHGTEMESKVFFVEKSLNITPQTQPDCSLVVCTQDSSDLQTLTPMTKVDCSKVLCTTDGIGQPEQRVQSIFQRKIFEQEPIVLPAPYIGVETEQD